MYVEGERERESTLFARLVHYCRSPWDWIDKGEEQSWCFQLMHLQNSTGMEGV